MVLQVMTMIRLAEKVLMHFEMSQIIVMKTGSKLVLMLWNKTILKMNSINITSWNNNKRELWKLSKKSTRIKWDWSDLIIERMLMNLSHQFWILILLTCITIRNQNLQFFLSNLKVQINISKRGCICFYTRLSTSWLTKGMNLTKIVKYLKCMELKWRTIINKKTLSARCKNIFKIKVLYIWNFSKKIIWMDVKMETSLVK